MLAPVLPLILKMEVLPFVSQIFVPSKQTSWQLDPADTAYVPTTEGTIERTSIFARLVPDVTQRKDPSKQPLMGVNERARL